MTTPSKRKVYTPLGRGMIVHTLRDGTLVVEFEHGGGHIFRPEELFRLPGHGKVKRDRYVTEGSHHQIQGSSMP